MNLILTAGPDPSSHVRSPLLASSRAQLLTRATTQVVVIQLCYLGARSVGDQFLQSIMSWEGERCLLKDVETRTFLTQQDSVLKVLSAQGPFFLSRFSVRFLMVSFRWVAAGNRWCIRANLMNSLPDECIYQTVAAFKNIPERSGAFLAPFPPLRTLADQRSHTQPGSLRLPLEPSPTPYPPPRASPLHTAQLPSKSPPCTYLSLPPSPPLLTLSLSPATNGNPKTKTTSGPRLPGGGSTTSSRPTPPAGRSLASSRAGRDSLRYAIALGRRIGRDWWGSRGGWIRGTR